MMKVLRYLPIALVFNLLAFEAIAQCDEPYPPGTGPNACQEAPLFCSEAEFDGYCSNTEATGVGICPAPFCGSCENYHWFSFVAGSSTISLEIVPSNCQGTSGGTGLQAHMYQTADCSTFTAISNCESPATATTITITANNLQVGQIYYLMIDGWAGDNCDYTINVLEGIGDVPVPNIPGGIIGEIEVCPGAVLPYFVPPAASATDYEWELIPASLGSISGNGDPNIDITFVPPGGTGQLCVTPSNACETGMQICIPIVSIPIPPTNLVVDLCLGQTVECGGNTYNQPGFFSETYSSYLGCDSIVNCQVNGIPPDLTIIQETLCAPDCYELGGIEYCQTGGYNQTFTNVNGCDSVVQLILIVLEAEAVISQPVPVLGCGPSATVILDGSGSTTTPQASGAVLSYLWTGPGIVGPDNQLTVEVNQTGTYTLTVTQELNGLVCTDEVSVTVTEDTTVPDQPNLNGPINICQFDTLNYTAAPAQTGPTPTGYTFVVTGGTFTQNNNVASVVWGATGTGTICVTADNDCGSSPDTCLTVNIAAAPFVPMIAGPDSVCIGDVVTFAVDPVDPNTENYIWEVTGGAQFIDNDTSISVDFSGSVVSGQVCVTGENDCGQSAQICVDVTVSDVPEEPVISGDDFLCGDGTGTYSVPVDTNVTNFVWTTPNGEPITGQGTNMIEVDWTGSSGGNVCVTAQNGCGQSPQNCFPVEVSATPTATFSGSGEFCTGSTDSVDITITLTGDAPWELTYDINGMNPVTITINSSPFTITTQEPGVYQPVFLADANGCVGTVSGTATVVENPLPTAAISGGGAICAGSGDCVDLIVDLTGTPNWTITYAIDGVLQAPVSGITATPFTLQACQAGDFTIESVTDGNGCTDVGTGTATVIVNDAPVVTGIQRPCDPTNTTYVVTFEITGGDPSSYTVNGSTTGISAGPPYIFTSDPIPNGDPYSFTVDDANGCNPVLVDGAKICDCTTAVGEMDSDPQSACGTDCITGIFDDTNNMFDGDDVLEFILHEGSGTTIVNEVQRNSIPEFCYVAGMTYGQTYYISAVIGNDDGTGSVDLTDPCLAVAQGTPVTFYEEPTATISGDVEICEGESADLTISFTGPAPYSIEYDDGSGTGPFVLNGINSNPYTLTVTPSATATFTLLSMSNANCDGQIDGTATVTVNTPPVVSNLNSACNATNTLYTITFEISSGDPASYEVLPAGSGTIAPGTPAVFTSNDISTGTPYAFLVFDQNGCDTISVAGDVTCDCTSQAGDMLIPALEECGDGPVNALYDDANEVLDGDDVVEFILHNGSGNSIGYPIIARSNTPSFGFDPGQMNYGQTYYISAIVGSDDGTGSVDDQNDPCLSVAVGTAVTFFVVPTATINSDVDICLGENINLPITLTGDSPYTLILSDGTNTDTVSGISSNLYNYNVSPSSTTTYTILEVYDENCEGIPSGTGVVNVNEAPVPSIGDVTINNNNTGYTVCFTITGGEPPYTVTDGSNTVTVDSVFCSNELPCNTGYLFEVDDGNDCGPAIVEDPQVVCDCVTQVGEMDQTLIEICGTGPAVSVYDSTLQTLDGNDVVDFILHNGNNVPIATNSIPSFGFTGALTYGQTYFISARAGNNNGSGNVNINDPCLSIADGTPVIFYQIPSGFLSGGGEICTGESIDLTLEINGGVAPWTVIYNDGTALDTITVNASPYTLTVSPTATTLYTLVDVLDANCDGSGNGVASVTLQGTPFAAGISTTIDPTNTFGTVCFTLIGGDSTTYVVNGDPGTLTGNQFCSEPIPCNTDYMFLIQDGALCVTDTVVGIVDCNCISNAGDMQDNAVTICEGATINLPDPSGTAFDANDVLMFYLHTGQMDQLGTVLAVNDEPSFAYDPALVECGQTYYISSVVGDDDGTGQVDLTDDCLSVAVGTPVVWNCLPEVDFEVVGSPIVCQGDEVTFQFDLSGEGPFNIVLNDGNQDILLENYNDGETYTFTPQDDITISLSGLFDLTTNCGGLPMGSISITVNEPLSAGAYLGPQIYCEGESAVVTLADLLIVEDAGGVWTETSSVPSTGGAFNAGAGTFNIASQPAGNYSFVYTHDNDDPCPDDSEIVNVIIRPLPTADAGPDLDLTCDEPSGTIGGSATSTGGNFTYEWTDALGAVVGNDATLDVDQSGVYTLTVTNTSTGCVSSDEVTVEESKEVPSANITVSDVNCFGDANGFITIDSIFGGVPPYLASFNGSPFSPQKQFFNLGPGVYDIVIQDANGCDVSLEFPITEPDELVVTLVADFQGENDFIELGDSITITAQLNIPFNEVDSIVWTPSDLINCDTCQSNSVTPELATTFSVWVENNSGCTDTDDLRVLVKKNRPVYIPNAFSPDGDGQNDIFFIQAGNVVVEVDQFLVFNRWGETVYQNQNFLPNDEEFGWDGTFRGEKLNPGVYTWFAEIEFSDGLVEIYKGDVVLIR